MKLTSPLKYMLILFHVGFCLSLLGCGSLLQQLKVVSTSEIRKADQENNITFLKEVCDGTRNSRPYTKTEACRMLKTRESLQGTCDNVMERFKKTTLKRKTIDHFALEMAECGMWTEFFEEIAHLGNAKRQPALSYVEQKMKAKKVSVKAKYIEYLNQHKGKKFFALKKLETRYALQHIGNWLVDSNHLDLCNQVVASAKGASEIAQVWTLPYLTEAKCTKKGSKIAQGLLASDYADHRKWSCNALAKIGNKSHIKKLKILATTDSFKRIREERRGGRIWAVEEYPVRDACKAAMGKIQLRD